MFVAPWKLAPRALPNILVDHGTLASSMLAAAGHSAQLLGAPPGFGKTTLLACVHRLWESDQRVAVWITIGERDSPDRLLNMFHAGLDRAGVAQGAIGRPEDGRERLIERIQEEPRPVGFFLDDADRAPTATRSLIADIIREVPPGTIIIATARNSRLMPLARALANGEVRLIAARLLLLSQQDAAVLSGGASTRRIQDVMALTCGWPLATAKLLDGDVEGPNDLGDRMDDLFDYVEQELIPLLSETELRTLTACCLLPRISSSSAHIVTGNRYAWDHIDAAARKLGPLCEMVPDKIPVFCLNPILQAFLQKIFLRTTSPDGERIVAETCAVLSRDGLIADAVRVAQDAGFPDLALRTILDQGGLALWPIVGTDEIRDVIRYAGSELVAREPKLQLMSALLKLKRGEIAEAERLYQSAASAWAGQESNWDLSIARLALLVYGCRRPSEEDLAVCEDLVEQLKVQPTWHTWIEVSMCIMETEAGALDTASRHAASGLAAVSATEQPYASVFLNYHSAAIAAARGEMQRAREMLKAARFVLRTHYAKDRGAETIGAIQAAEIDYEMGMLAKARARLRLTTSELHEMEGWFDIYAAALSVGARLVQNDLGLEAAREYLRAAEAIFRRRDLGRVADYLAVFDELLVGEAWLSGQSEEIPTGFGLPPRVSALGWRETEAYDLAEAYASLAAEENNRVDETLDGLVHFGHQHGLARPQLRALLLKAVALDRRGEDEAAYGLVIHALGIGFETGLKRSFYDFGGQVLLKHLARATREIDGEVREFAAGILQQLQRGLGNSETPRLTQRELQVLSGLGDGASDKVLGRRLGVSEHAVRFHLKNIFNKLRVHSRAEAMAQAQRLGLLADETAP